MTEQRESAPPVRAAAFITATDCEFSGVGGGFGGGAFVFGKIAAALYGSLGSDGFAFGSLEVVTPFLGFEGCDGANAHREARSGCKRRMKSISVAAGATCATW